MSRNAYKSHNGPTLFDPIQPSPVPPLPSPARREAVEEDELQVFMRQCRIAISYVAHKKVLYAICASATLGLVYVQSVPLYASSGFAMPQVCAVGALLMVVGFAVMHSLTRSKIALILCLYATSYEVALIVKGTVKDDSVNSLKAPELVFLQENADRSLAAYNENKARYNDESSDVYHNPWFKRQVDASWRKYGDTQSKLTQKTNELNVPANSSLSYLKIFYRLGLVFLCMISFHHLLRSKENTRN